MAEWHVPPDYIVSNWTDELLNLMTEKFVERKGKESDSLRGKSHQDVSAEELSTRSRGMIKVVKK